MQREGAEEEENMQVMLAVAPRSGHLEIYVLPGLQLVYKASDFVVAPQLLMDEAVAPPDTQLDEMQELPFIMDLKIELVPDCGERATDPAVLCLVAITSHADLLVYKSFCYRADAEDGIRDSVASRGVRRCV